MNSSPGYYSILDPFDQRSEYSKLILKEFDEKENIYVVDHESQKCCTVYAMLGQTATQYCWYVLDFVQQSARILSHLFPQFVHLSNMPSPSKYRRPSKGHSTANNFVRRISNEYSSCTNIQLGEIIPEGEWKKYHKFANRSTS